MGTSSSLAADAQNDCFPWHAFANERKMVLLKEQTNHNRKSLCILNGNAKNRLVQYNTILSRERDNASFNFWNQTSPIKQTLLRKRIMQKCLNRMRSRVSDSKPEQLRMGRYHGVSLEDMKGEVDEVIADMDPKCQRMRRVNKLLQKDSERRKEIESKTKKLITKIDSTCTSRENTRVNKDYNKIGKVILAPAIVTRWPSDLHEIPVAFKNSRFHLMPPIAHDNMKHDQGRLRLPTTVPAHYVSDTTIP